ncbi:unnamed protein product, partial [marine sediment metagenome]
MPSEYLLEVSRAKTIISKFRPEKWGYAVGGFFIFQEIRNIVIKDFYNFYIQWNFAWFFTFG